MFNDRQREALHTLAAALREEARFLLKTGHECAVHSASALQSAAGRIENLADQKELPLGED